MSGRPPEKDWCEKAEQNLEMARIVEDPTNVGFIPLHRDVDRALLPMAARKAGEIVHGADEVLPPLALALPRSMQAGFTTVFDRLFKKLNTLETEIDVSEIHLRRSATAHVAERGLSETITHGAPE